MKPFQRAYIPQSEIDALRDDLKAKPPEYFEKWIGPGCDRAKIEEYIDETVLRSAGGERWNNDKYQVVIFDADTKGDFPPMWHISIKRHDRYPVFNWRDIQTLKNQLVGPENEAVQLFPAESRLVDGANQYHLFCLKDAGVRFPFGFPNRVVTDEPIGSDKFGGRNFRTTDGRLCAKVYWYNGMNYMRICYASFVSKNGLWRYDSKLPSRPSQKPKANQPPPQKDLLPLVEEVAN
jgi:hypothetical protein